MVRYLNLKIKSDYYDKNEKNIITVINLNAVTLFSQNNTFGIFTFK
jgi:hypothetical protein